MPSYRCYFIGRDDHIQAAENIDADDIGEAVERGLVMLKERPQYRSIELWEGAERVYPPDDHP